MGLTDRINQGMQIPDDDRPQRIISQAGGAMAAGSVIRRAVAQEASQTDGLLSVKFADAGGIAYGPAFDVFAAPDESAMDMTDYQPQIAADDIVLITTVQNKWFLIWPPVLMPGCV